MLHAAIRTCSKICILSSLEAWNLVRMPRIAQRGFLSLFQRINPSTPTTFHVGIMICSRTTTMSLLEAWGLVPKSKSSTRGHFSACVYILPFSVHHAAYLYQFLCCYQILHDYCAKLPHYFSHFLISRSCPRVYSLYIQCLGVLVTCFFQLGSSSFMF